MLDQRHGNHPIRSRTPGRARQGPNACPRVALCRQARGAVSSGRPIRTRRAAAARGGNLALRNASPGNGNGRFRRSFAERTDAAWQRNTEFALPCRALVHDDAPGVPRSVSGSDLLSAAALRPSVPLLPERRVSGRRLVQAIVGAQPLVDSRLQAVQSVLDRGQTASLCQAACRRSGAHAWRRAVSGLRVDGDVRRWRSAGANDRCDTPYA